MATIFSYWLLPAEPADSALRAQITGLAERYGAVAFEPHATLYSGPSDEREVAETIAWLRPSFRPLTLVPHAVGQSSRLTKTLYIRLELSSELAALSEAVGRRARLASDVALDDPHVSLLYQRLADDERARLAMETAVPAPFRADGIAVIETETPVDTLDKVRRWRPVARFRAGE